PGVTPVLMAAANSSGGVMGKMIDMQSIVVAATATNWTGHEGRILRFTFWHSIVLAILVGLFVMLQAYVPPFTEMVLCEGGVREGWEWVCPAVPVDAPITPIEGE